MIRSALIRSAGNGVAAMTLLGFSSLGLSPFATVSAMYVLGFAGIMIVAFDAAVDGGEDD